MKTLKTVLLVILLLSLKANTFSQTNNKAMYFENLNLNTKNSSVYFASANYNLTDKMTIGVWVKWSAKPDSLVNVDASYKWANILTNAWAVNSQSDQGQFWLQHSSDNSKFEFTIKAGSNRQFMQSNTKPIVGKWYYISGVYDGSSPDTTMRLYVNGVLESWILKSTISGNITSYNPNQRMTSGRIPSNYREFVGFLDEMRLWKRALTKDEIVKQMYSQSTVNTIDLASYWDFNTSQGSTLTDQGPAGFSGKFYKGISEVDVYTLSGTTYSVTDSSKNWGVNSFAGLNLKTISGTGIDESNIVVSNTSNVLYLQTPLLTLPTLNGGSYMTLFGVEAGTGDNSMWVASLAPLNNGTLDGLNDLAGDWNANVINTSSVLTLSNTNIINDENVLFGNNGLDLTFTSSDVPSGANSRINRVWKFQTNKSAGLTGKIDFNLSTLTVSNIAALRLVVSTIEASFASGTVINGTIAGTNFTVNSASIPNGAYISLGSVDSPLPVAMESFTYSVDKRNVKLTWKTSKEINNNGFDAERAPFNGNYVKVSFIKGYGNTNSEKVYSYTDANLNTGKYKYRLKQTDYNGNYEYHNLSGEVNIGVPSEYELSQNYPNPFNPSTKIDFSLPVDSKVTIKLYDISGKEVINIMNKQESAGYHTANIDASLLSSGTYFCQMKAVGTDGKSFTTSKKMILSK
ncbi:MAG: LamG-like jellyroll fold domain-containing protein [Ignavibacteriota bacterium]